MIRPGGIYYANFDEMEPHPVVIVSREDLNRGNWVVAVLVTSSKYETRSRLLNCVAFQAGEFGLVQNCVAQAESIFSIRREELDGPIGSLDDERMRELVKAIGFVIASDCEPV